jgi:hypothetical protein
MAHNATELDEIVSGALRSLMIDLSAPSWYGREREIVSLYVLGHLLPLCRSGSVLSEATQIGIEVAVPQHNQDGPAKRHVCKDVVIWPRPKMTVWGANGDKAEYPLCVIEWKSVNRRDTPTQQALKRADYDKIDIEWLRRTSELSPEFTGYAVLVVQGAGRPTLECAGAFAGAVEREWLTL